MNIMDGMDAARFKSGNPGNKTKNSKNIEEKQKDEKEMPMVLKNLNNS
ncbi:MAG: hypothetical protein K0S39_5564 [Paenibacillus sp.]|jgi:hypothetical protein|nr:hypothetical protein [Paenibacillus sp.]